MAISTSVHTAGAADNSGRSYIDWPAIFAGAAFATALAFVLFTFGSGLGLSMASPEPGEGTSLRWITIAAGLWFIWVAVSSFAAGGYLAGRMRRRIGDATSDEVELRDGAHGMLVWAVGALFGAILAAVGIGGIVGTTAATVDTAVEALDDETGYFSSLMLRSNNGAFVDNAEARDEIAMVLERSLSSGEVAPGDRQYLAQIVAAETGLAPLEAEAQVDATLTEAETARQVAIDAAEQARIAGIIAAFIAAATMLVSAGAAFFAASLGGGHRDQNVPFGNFSRVETKRPQPR